MSSSARAFKRIFSCKIWLRHSLERALSSLPDRAVQLGIATGGETCAGPSVPKVFVEVAADVLGPFQWLVLGYINTDFCKGMFIFQSAVVFWGGSTIFSYVIRDILNFNIFFANVGKKKKGGTLLNQKFTESAFRFPKFHQNFF